MIVGHKIEQSITVRAIDYGSSHLVTTTRKLSELHATKGWRRIGAGRDVKRVINPPSPRSLREGTFTRFKPTRQPGPTEQRPDWIDTISKAARERAVMRHAVRRVEIARARNKARNEAEDRQLAAS